MKLRQLITPLSFLICTTLYAQADYTAVKSSKYQIGVAGLLLDNDNTSRKAGGITAYGDFDFSRFVGAEVEAHFGAILSPDDVGENTYFVGSRFFYRRRRATVYGKLMIGRASISNAFDHISHTYNSYAFGGGVEYQLTRHINLRPIDVELQKCPDYEPHTLSPLAVSFGAAYVF